MSIFDDMIYGLKQDTEIPKDVWKKYTDTLSNLPDKQGEPSSHTFFKKSMWPTVAVVALVIRSMIRDKRNGKSLHCGGDCKHCGGHCPHTPTE